jgi:hypothetical protein
MAITLPNRLSTSALDWVHMMGRFYVEAEPVRPATEYIRCGRTCGQTYGGFEVRAACASPIVRHTARCTSGRRTVDATNTRRKR